MKDQHVVNDLFGSGVCEKIAAELSTRGFSIDDNFLSEHEISDLVGELLSAFRSGEFKKAGVGHEDSYRVVEQIRGDYIHWIAPGDSLRMRHPFFRKITGLRAYLENTLSIQITDFEIHFAIYPPGARYQRHRDQFLDDKSRKVSLVCYLNSDWVASDGGQLSLFLPIDEDHEAVITIAPRGGRLVCFDSRLEHEVAIAHRQRYSITGWLRSVDPEAESEEATVARSGGSRRD